MPEKLRSKNEKTAQPISYVCADTYGWHMSSPTLDASPSPSLGLRDLDDTGVSVHPIALDGSVFGWASGIDDTAKVLDLFHGSGGNLVSTADHYAGGRSEIMIGRWIRTLSDRSSVILATKVGRHPDAVGLSSRSILRAVESSLERLSTDYIDFLSFDGDHPETPIDEALEAVERLIREGKVRFLSASDFSSARIDEVASLAAAAGYPAFRAVFVEYNLMDRARYETELQAVATRLGRGAVARMPLAGGFLSDQFLRSDILPDGVMFDRAMQHIGRRGTRVLEALDTVAGELGTTLSRVALAWVLVKPGIAAAAVRAKDPDQLADLLGAAGVGLTRQQAALLDKVSAA
jgi:aryl-alcohol dehydrogenase-like predicted oxidoreductase